MNTICSDNILLIFNNLSFESARQFGLTCTSHFVLYRKYICVHPILNNFKETLIKIREKEEKELATKEYLEGFTMSKIYKDLDINNVDIQQIFKPDFRSGAGRGIPMRRPPTQSSKIISKETVELAYNSYLAQLDSIIANTQKNLTLYNELSLPVLVKYLINI